MAGQLASAAIDGRSRNDLREWLTEQLDGRDLVVVKDPRAAWVPQLWAEEAAALGAELSYVTMIRHPSEVIGSRSTYYATYRPSMAPREFAVWNLCGWINQNLTLERQTRDSSRAFVVYTDLLKDWRRAVIELLADYDSHPISSPPARRSRSTASSSLGSGATPCTGAISTSRAVDRHRRGHLGCLARAHCSTRPRVQRREPGQHRHEVRRSLRRRPSHRPRPCLRASAPGTATGSTGGQAQGRGSPGCWWWLTDDLEESVASSSRESRSSATPELRAPQPASVLSRTPASPSRARPPVRRPAAVRRSR